MTHAVGIRTATYVSFKWVIRAGRSMRCVKRGCAIKGDAKKHFSEISVLS